MIHPYQQKTYATCFGSEYEPFALTAANTYVLLRDIDGTNARDALGVYPLCPIDPIADLAADLEALRKSGAVSLVLVADPFHCPPAEKMQQWFEIARPFKEHYLCDLKQDLRYSKHHRYEVRRAIAQCDVRNIDLGESLDAWYALYHHLIVKHNMNGIQAFPRSYFEQLAALKPVMLGAFSEGELISAHLWIIHGEHAYSHLAASNDEGYRLRAAYAVYDASIEYLRAQGIRIIDLGGGAGNQASKGLTFLKQGFSNANITCSLYGAILNPEGYRLLSKDKTGTEYFPAYRAP